MNGKIEQGLHEKLCAYVLGEIDGTDRAEVERELLRSPELRAERERLESTIGAVREALKPAQTLSPEAKQALERAVRPAPIAQFPWLRLAAGIGAVGLGWWIFAQAPGRRDDMTVAHLEAPGVGPMSRAEEGARDLAELERAKNEWPTLSADEKDAVAKKFGSLGYTGVTSEPASAAVTPKASGLVVGQTASPTPSELVQRIDRVAPPKVEEAELVAMDGEVTDAVGGSTLSAGKAPKPGIAPGAAPAPLSRRAPAPGKGRASGPTVAPAEAAPPGAQETLIVQDSARWREVSSSRGLELPPYRGPGDGVPPGGGGGGAGGLAPTSTGPSTPAPTSIMTGTDPFYVNDPLPEVKLKQQLADDAQLRAQMAAAGYASDDGDEAKKARNQNRPWSELTPVEQAQQLELRYGTIVQGCFPRPNERPRDMFFRFWGDNPFEVTMLDKLSTFSVDVDTASYALARRYLDEGRVPEKAQIRTEEFVNYFASDVEAPRNATFSVHSDLTPSRFSADSARQMLRVVVRAKDVDKAERQPMHLTFVVDVSGSMKEQNRLETVKHALRMLVAQLDARDSIALVKFSNDANLVLPMTSVVDRATIEAAIAPLVPEGSTNSNAGLQLGYAQALTGLDPNAVNRVVFLSDGVANVGETDAAKILEGVKSIREKGIFLNTIGVGMNNHNDVLLEQLADKGDGLCNYVDSPKEIQRALVDRFTGAFQPIAKDVKIQVEFDPAQVMRYRLLGYENRAIADADFRNDAVDAGEIGAGHQVTALYEIEPTGRAGDGPMATVRLRWKPIRAAGASGVQEATEASFDVSAKSYQAFEASPPGHRRALIVAQFAEILRRSIHARGESLDDLIVEAGRLQAQIPNDKDFAEFTTLLLRAKDSILRTLPACDELCQTIDALRSNQYLGAVMSESRQDASTLQEIEATRLKLEERLRELLRQQAEGSGRLDSLGYTDGKK